MSDHCPNCLTPWDRHYGLISTCERATVAEARAKRLEEALRGLVYAADSANACSHVRRDACRHAVRAALETARKAMEEA